MKLTVRGVCLILSAGLLLWTPAAGAAPAPGDKTVVQGFGARTGSVEVGSAETGPVQPASVAGSGLETSSDPGTSAEATSQLAPPRRTISPRSSGIPRRPMRGCSTAPSDFNGDGRSDLALSELGSGGVHATRVILAASIQLSARTQYFTPASPGMPPGFVQPGWALATGYFNADCYADLAVGDVSEQLLVLYGGMDGLSTARLSVITFAEVAPGVASGLFGTVLTAGDFDGDGLDDLVAGAPRSGFAEIGGIALLRGTDAGLTPTARQWIPGDDWRLPVRATGGEWFGGVLEAGDFNGDGRDDLAVGFDRDDVEVGGTAVSAAGSVVVLPGGVGGLDLAAGQRFHQDSPGVPDSVELTDQFGSSLAAGDVTGDGLADLAVATYNEGELTPEEGYRGWSITLLRGSTGGLTAEGAQYLSRQTPGVPGGELQFGVELALGDFDGDGHHDLAAGSYHDRFDAVRDAGSVTVFPGTVDGLSVVDAQLLTRETPGIPGDAASSEFFGQVLLVVKHPAGRTDLMIGTPYFEYDGLRAAGAVLVLPGGPGGIQPADAWVVSAAGATPGPHADAYFGRVIA